MKRVNRKAYHEFLVMDEYVSGLVLVGSEVKSLRIGDFNFTDSYIVFIGGEVFLKNFSISKYKNSSYQNHEEKRDRKLLLSKKEIERVSKEYNQKGITIVPLEIFTIGGRFKMKIGVCKGKKNWNKKEDIKRRDIEREFGRKFK
jgi:SsrA-binding protein